ncbi:hypothetical protein BATDEDRAFT_90629 [Batrachochytrium dendrobatidis JAM81]|uniref:Uncharacterized protein n=1 Tax=Batrachochytrium dendrobatidis (strain JAM81 / FGSC 10211) TaxID=684364 RepID=F4P8D6_BATDJ|nr:uncharacterized protein BATDEDRAFT_90629 [Batrachochytrium dendrobatidis JAM81]EGF78416.1 hypothetical protein BATDEDRAFT_90629 [Batrachochytrium dendrobatidis JAM81]|eukprot:XP_006680830.1 hypothetical protein BATDEDRAFT_90629 [Batrachochytrium dendrobatidis JAM81]
MKLVEILFVLSVAATANAILIPADNDDSPQASGTSSQLSGPTNEPNPGTSEYWKSLMDIINSKNPNQDQQDPIDIVDPSTSRRGRKRPIDELGPSISEQDWKLIIDQPDPGIPEDWRDLIDAVNSNILKDQQQSMSQPSPSTLKRSRKRPIDQPSSRTPKRGKQQLMGQGRSANTSSNQAIVLSKEDQETLDDIKKILVVSKKIQKKKWQAYHENTALAFSKQLALTMGQRISESRYNPEVEKQLKQEYKKAGTRVCNLRQRLKRFMRKRGLKFEEPN